MSKESVEVALGTLSQGVVEEYSELRTKGEIVADPECLRRFDVTILDG
jgi:hypothetical protein